MTQADDLIAKYPELVKKRKGPPCSVGASKHRPLIDALCSRELTHRAIYRVLQAEKIYVSYNAIIHHRRGECQCPPR